MLAHTRQFPTSLDFLVFALSDVGVAGPDCDLANYPGRVGPVIICFVSLALFAYLSSKLTREGVGEDSVHNIESACRRRRRRCLVPDARSLLR